PVRITIARQEMKIASEYLSLRLFQHGPDQCAIPLRALDPAVLSVGKRSEFAERSLGLLAEKPRRKPLVGLFYLHTTHAGIELHLGHFDHVLDARKLVGASQSLLYFLQQLLALLQCFCIRLN